MQNKAASKHMWPGKKRKGSLWLPAYRALMLTGCAPKRVGLLRGTYPSTLSAIFITTVTIKGCGCCWDTLAGANISFVVEPAATVSTYLEVFWDIKLYAWSPTTFSWERLEFGALRPG